MELETKDSANMMANQVDFPVSDPDDTGTVRQAPNHTSVSTIAYPLVSPVCRPEVIYSQPTTDQSSWGSQPTYNQRAWGPQSTYSPNSWSSQPTDSQPPNHQSVSTLGYPLVRPAGCRPEAVYSEPLYNQSSWNSQPTYSQCTWSSQPTYSQWSSQARYSDQSASSIFTLDDTGVYPPPHSHRMAQDSAQHQPAYSDVMTSGQMEDNSDDIAIPKDYMGWSICTALFCCLMCGALAACYSCDTTKYIRKGDLVKAKESSIIAKQLNIIGTVVGLLISIASIGVIILTVFID